jgi:hypothetical protein
MLTRPTKDAYVPDLTMPPPPSYPGRGTRNVAPACNAEARESNRGPHAGRVDDILPWCELYGRPSLDADA